MRNPNKTYPARPQAKKCGITETEATRAEKERGAYCSFGDVKAACHKFLMERDEVYRQQAEAWTEERNKAKSRPFAGY